MARNGSGDWIDQATWADEDDPGAGGQNFTTDVNGTGLNGNFIRLWKAITTFFSGYGTVSNDKIDGNALKASAVDGTTIEASASTGTKAFRVKDLGVTAAKLATDAVETAKIKDVNVTAAKLATDAVETAKIKDANVTTAKIADANVTGIKMAYNQKSRQITFGPWTLPSGAYAQSSDLVVAGVTGLYDIPMPDDGSVVGVVVNANGTVYAATAAYGANSFAGGAKLRLNTGNGVAWKLRAEGVDVITVTVNTSVGPVSAFVLVELSD